MTRIQWLAPGQRFYEYGVQRGVLYVGGTGVPWNGLTSVEEDTDGGSLEAYWIDGTKYLLRSTTEDFQATISAYTYPDEFNACDGNRALYNGLYATSQRRKRFGLCYRTEVGNDLNGRYGYKLHIVHNAMAEPSQKSRQTVSEDIEPVDFSWRISTRPDVVRGFRPTAHFVIDSREVPEELMTQLEDILYGTDTTSPRLPPAGELIFLMDSYQNPVHDAGFSGDPVYSIIDGGGAVQSPLLGTIDCGGA